MLKNRYTDSGTIFFKPEENSWIVQINYNFGGGGASFKVVKWATWENPHFICALQETNEDPEMYGWKIATDADIVLYCKNQNIIDNLEKIKALIRLGYKGKHATSDTLLAEIEWRML